MSTVVTIALILGLTAAAVILAGICYGVREGIARLVEDKGKPLVRQPTKATHKEP